MARINFIVRVKKEGQPSTVLVRYSDKGGIDFLTSTQEKVFPEYWSFETQSFKQRIDYSDIFTEQQKTDIEDRLTEIKAFINAEYFKLKGVPVSKEWFKSTIDKLYHVEETPVNETLTQYIKRFIEEAKTGERLATAGNSKKRYAYGTLRVLKGCQLSFEMFCQDKKKEYNFNDITIDFYNDFIRFYYGRNCGANYIGKLISTLKTIIRQAREEGFHSNMEIERKAFKTLKEPVESIYLTEAELKRIYELDLSDNKPSEIMRDVFLAGCYTAQRYSDYSKLNKDNIKVIEGNRVIVLTQKKTGEKCLIPIRPELETILKKYDYTLPKTFEQKVNDAIKLIGGKAKINELVHIEKNRGGTIVKRDVKKCDLIKTHTARRTGCTLMYLAGIPTIDIMKISGHKTEREFIKYVKVGKQETALRMASHPYFIGNPLSIAK